MSRQHFRRVWKVTFYRARTSSGTGFARFFETVPNGIEIEKLRVQAQIEKGLEKEPNKCSLMITNLADGTRSNVCRKPGIVRVEAGYAEDEGLRLLFQGDLRSGFSRQDGPDWITELDLLDGGRAYQHARTNKSYRAGTPISTMLRDAAATMGLRLPAAVEADPTLTTGFASGRTLTGATADQLTALLRPYGYNWSIQNGRLVVLRDEDTDTSRALLVSRDTGLLGSPEMGAPTSDDPVPELKMRMLLYPQVNPGQLLSVQSRYISGIFRAEKVVHVLDTHGDDWFTDIEAKPAEFKRR